MTKTSTVRSRMEPSLKHRAEAIFSTLGLSSTQAITLFYRQVELRGGLPFDVALPSKNTRRSLKATNAGRDLVECRNVENMFKRLGVKETLDRKEDEALLRLSEKNEAETDRYYSSEEAWGQTRHTR